MKKDFKGLLKKASVVACTFAVFGGAIMLPSQARYVQELHDFRVNYYGSESYTAALKKTVDGSSKHGAAVINLKGDDGTAWIDVNLRDGSNTSYGFVQLQRGNRVAFGNRAKAGSYYKLGIRKTYVTGNGVCFISGSWSPDNK